MMSHVFVRCLRLRTILRDIKFERQNGEKITRRNVAHCSSIVATRKYCTALVKEEEDIQDQKPSSERHLSKKVQEMQDSRLKALLKEPKHLKSYKELCATMEMLTQLGVQTPNLSGNDIIMLLHMHKAKQMKYLNVMAENQNREKIKRKEQVKNNHVLDAGHFMIADDERVYYGLFRNSMFLRIYEQTQNQFLNTKLIHSMVHEKPLVIDLAYENCMTYVEKHFLAKQIVMLFGLNRKHQCPFNIELWGLDEQSDIMMHLQRQLPTIKEDNFPINITDKSVVEGFSKSELVFLSPDSQNTLKTYDPEAVYVIGGIVDKGEKLPLTYAKAKKYGIKTARLPLNLLTWGKGLKSLTLDQATMILLDYRMTKDWRYALRHVPRRKVYKPDE